MFCSMIWFKTQGYCISFSISKSQPKITLNTKEMAGMIASHDNDIRPLPLHLSVSQQADRHDDEPWINIFEVHAPCSL